MKLTLFCLRCYIALFCYVIGLQNVSALEPNISSQISIKTEQLGLGGQLARFKNLHADEQGYVRNTSSDGYFTFRDLDIRRDQACALSLDLEFEDGMSRPGLFEFFWHGPKGSFTESQKGFVLINQEDTLQRTTFVIPICKLFHFSGNINQASKQLNIGGLRLDFPSNKDIAIKFHSIELLDAEQMVSVLSNTPSTTVVLEPYERLSPQAATSLDVILPKLFFIFEEGLQRLWIDKGFLIFWLILISIFKVLLLRSFLTNKN